MSKGDMVIVWSKPSCVQCTATERNLNAKNIAYEIRDISLPENAHILEAFKEDNLMQAPIVEAPGMEPWSGFRPDLISQYAAA